MKTNKFLKMLFLALIILNLSSNLYAQECPPTVGNWVENFGAWYEPRPSNGVYAASKYKWRKIGNVYDIKVDWALLTSFIERPGLTIEEKKEFVRAAIMNYHRDPCANPDNITYTFKFYETVNCETEKTCYIKLDQTLRIVCVDNAFPTWAIPDYQYNGIYYFPYKTKSVCGTSCCITHYEVKCVTSNSPITGYFRTRLEVQNKFTTNYGCPTTTNTDCHTNQLIPCIPICN